MLALVLALLVGGGSAPPAPAPLAVAAVPAEEGAVMLPERSTYQAVVVDLDGDGSREVVRLALGDRGAIVAEGWRHRPSGWDRIGEDVEITPPRVTGTQGSVVYAGTPTRLLVRLVEGADRVTVVRQPRFEEPGDAIDGGCCLILHDLELREDRLLLRPVAEPYESVDAILAIDLDGDRTDELLASRAMPPRGDISFPSRAAMFRWTGESFASPVVSDLAVGSGDAPFVLGDTDGRPGLEAGIISTRGRPTLSRVVLDEGDAVRTDNSGLVVTDARAVPTAGGRGLAVVGPLTGLAVHEWPAGEAPQPAVAAREMPDGRILGLVEAMGGPAIVVEQPEPTALHVLSVPELSTLPGAAVTRSATAGTLASSPMRPYVGPLPRGGQDGREAVLYAGHLLPGAAAAAPFGSLGDTRFAVLGGVEPVGLAGPDAAWIALLHGTVPTGRIDPSGGRLEPPMLRVGSGVSLAPLSVARAPEEDDGALDPPVVHGVPIGDRGTIAVGADGFIAHVKGPPGSRVYVSDADPSVVVATRVIPGSGTLAVPLFPPETSMPNPRYRASLGVATPAGHGYVASWDVRSLLEPPPLSVTAETKLGALAADVRGVTAGPVTVTVDGREAAVDAEGRFEAAVDALPWPREVVVVASDVLGNETQATVSVVGLVDYRGLPWVPIMVALVAAVAALLFLRVPRPGAGPRHDDDATLEELDPD